MRSLLMVLVLVGVCVGADEKPTVQGKEPTYEGKTVSEWIALTKDKDPKARATAARALGGIDSEAEVVVPVLVRLARDRSFQFETWQAAEGALEKFGPPAIPALIKLLKNTDTNVRHAAVQALGRIGPEAKAAVPALTELLKDKNDQVRQAAAQSLGNVGPEAGVAVPALTELLKAKDKWDRQAAARALGDIGAGASTAVPALTELLNDKDDQVRHAAAHSLGKIGPQARTAIPALTELLKVKDKWDRQTAARALGDIGAGASTAVSALTELLNDKDDLLQLAAAQALGKIGPQANAAVPALVGLLKDENVRAAAVWALAEIGPEAKAAIPALVTLLTGNSEYWSIRQAAAWALAKIGAPSVPPLTGLLKNKRESVQWLAVWSLGRIGSEAKAAVPALIDLLKEEGVSFRLCIVQSLGQIGPQAETVVPALTRLLKDKDVLVRRAAAKALMQIDPEAKAAVAELLKDKSVDVRDVASAVLGGNSLETKATEAETKRIKGLIADLAKTGSPDFGLSPTLTGDAFAPIPSSGHFGMGLLTNHGLQRNGAFTSLVELGPKALPLLLESLDDKTPTKLTITHGYGMGGMWFGHEIWGNVFNKQERKTLPDGDDDLSFMDQSSVNEYTVKVGDVCFVIIGQITNRSYNAVRYQPTACIVLNSTTQDKRLAAEVRAVWGKGDYRQKLLDSLLIDFDSRDRLQDSAAMRLAYYSPEASVGLIIARLKELDSLATGEDLLKAVSWSSQPRIRAALLEIFRTTKDSKVLLAALPGLGKEHDELVFHRLAEQLAGLPTNEPGPYSDGYYLLIALGNRFPDRAEEVFRNFLKPGTIERRRTAVHALEETCGHLVVKLLTPLLDDKRETGGRYSVDLLPIRVCDEAATTIASHSKTLTFVTEGVHENRDRQIEVMRRKIIEMNTQK